jgi:hypothetical protein
MPNDFERAMGYAGSATPTAFIPDEADALLQQLAETHQPWAWGAARYGPGGTFDASRKAFLAVRSAQVRDEYADRGEKITEARLDEVAHADEGYREWLDAQTIDRASWLKLDAEREEIKTRLRFLQYTVTPR